MNAKWHFSESQMICKREDLPRRINEVTKPRDNLYFAQRQKKVWPEVKEIIEVNLKGGKRREFRYPRSKIMREEVNEKGTVRGRQVK